MNLNSTIINQKNSPNSNKERQRAYIPPGVESFLSVEQTKAINQQLKNLSKVEHTALLKQIDDLNYHAKCAGYSLDEISEAFLDLISDISTHDDSVTNDSSTKQHSISASASAYDILELLNSDQVSNLIAIAEQLTEIQEQELFTLLNKIDLRETDSGSIQKIKNKILNAFAYVTGEDLSQLSTN